MQQSRQTHDHASVQQYPPEASDRRYTAGPAQQSRFEFIAGIAGHPAKRASPHISRRRGSKFQSFRTPRHRPRTEQSRQGKNPAVALHSALALLLPSARRISSNTSKCPWQCLVISRPFVIWPTSEQHASWQADNPRFSPSSIIKYRSHSAVIDSVCPNEHQHRYQDN